MGAQATQFSIEGLARLYEGEGTTGCQLGGRLGKSPYFFMRIYSTDEDLIRAVHAQFGGSVQGFDRPTRKRCFQWTIGGNRGAALAEEMRPYLFSRRTEQLDRALLRWYQRPKICPEGQLALIRRGCEGDAP